MNNFDDLFAGAPAETQSQPQLSKEDWVAKKQAEREAVFALSDDVAMSAAEDGGILHQYLNVQATFGRYSAVNALLILAQKPDATRLADFDSWKEKGGSVKPGQKGISILEPHEYTKEDGSPGTGYNVKKVFDISQVDTRKLKTRPTPQHSERQILSALVKSSPVPIVGVERLPDDVGAQRQEDRIEVKKGMGFVDTFHCLAHEIFETMLPDDPDSRVEPQFTAYCASYLLCKKFGVDTRGFDFSSAPYTIETLNAQQVKGELSKIRDCADEISGSMARQLGAMDKAAKNQEAR